MAKRFAAEGKRVITLDDTGCLCTTMYRISPQHLAWALENQIQGARGEPDRGETECKTSGARRARPHAGMQGIGTRE